MFQKYCLCPMEVEVRGVIMVAKVMTYGVTSDPRTDYILARSKDVNDRTEVREGGARIGNCTCSDSVGRGSTSGRGACSVGIAVTRGNLGNLGSKIKIMDPGQ